MGINKNVHPLNFSIDRAKMNNKARKLAYYAQGQESMLGQSPTLPPPSSGVVHHGLPRATPVKNALTTQPSASANGGTDSPVSNSNLGLASHLMMTGLSIGRAQMNSPN